MCRCLKSSFIAENRCKWFDTRINKTLVLISQKKNKKHTKKIVISYCRILECLKNENRVFPDYCHAGKTVSREIHFYKITDITRI